MSCCSNIRSEMTRMSAKSALQMCLAMFMGAQMKWVEMSAGRDLRVYNLFTSRKQMKWRNTINKSIR